MQAFGSILRTTRISLILTASVLTGACESGDKVLKPDAPEKAEADSGVTQDAGKSREEDAAVETEVVTDEEDEEAEEEASSGVKSSRGEQGWCGVRKTMQAACTSCHNEDKVAGAPMSLLTYDDLQKPAVSDKKRKVYELVKERVHDKDRPMPPQMKLSDAQLAGIDAWVEAGAAAGDDVTCGEDTADAEGGTQAAPALDFEWPENCDKTYRIVSHAEDSEDAPFAIKPGEEIHPQVYVDAPWGDESVQAIAWRPITDNARILHHWILYGANREFLVGWAPGKDGALMHEDVGMLLVGGRLRLDMHYNNLGNEAEEQDGSGVELCVVDKQNFRKNTATVAQTLGAFIINLPPRATNVDVKSTCTLNGEEPVTLLTASPHAHRLAKHMKFTLERADGEVIVMHDQSFHFEEQGQFDLEKPLVVNKGDKVTTVCTYDNDTDQTVTFGEDTGNEMCFNFALYYPQGALRCSFSQ
jgi:hypothetical protein